MKMMKYLFLFSILSVAMVSNAQEIRNNQHTMVSKVTADWCPYCGTWGWSLFNDIKTQLANEKALIWAVHYSGGLATTTSKAIAANLESSGQPVFYVNEDDMGATSGNTSTTLNSIVESVEILNGFTPFVGIGANASWYDNKLTVNAKVKFNESVEQGEYYLGLYTMRHNVVAYQASIGSNANHNNLLTESLFPNQPFGSYITGAPIDLTKEFSFTASLNNVTLPKNDIKNVQLVAIVWNKNGTKYNFLNGEIFDLNLGTSTTDTPTEQTCNGDCQNGTIQITAFDNFKANTVFNLYDINGRMVDTWTQKSALKSAEHDISNLPLGLYIVQFVHQNKPYALKVLNK